MMRADKSVDVVVADLRGVVTESRPGDRLPSVRDLIRQWHVSPATVERALTLLVREGLVVTKPGSGSFVAEPRLPTGPSDLGWQALALGCSPSDQSALEELTRPLREGVISLSHGYLDRSLQPANELAKAAARASRRPESWARVPSEGIEGLRQWFARDAGSMEMHDVLVVPGGQTALATIFRAVCAPGDAVLFESPTYLGALSAARAAGLRPVPVPTDEHGLRTDMLEAAFRSSGARLVYVQPTFANPTGTVLGKQRRAELLEAARAAQAFVIEDDYARDLCFDGTTPPPLVSQDSDGRVIYVRSLTKIAAPGLRIAAICARGPVRARLRTTRLIDDFFVTGLMQEVALELVTSPSWNRHVRFVRDSLRERRDLMVKRLAGSPLRLTLLPRGGFSLWLELPPGMSEQELVREADRRGVRVTAGSGWFPAEPCGAFLRLGVAGTPNQALDAGLTLLFQAVDALRK